MTNKPPSHISDSQKLTGDAYVNLYEIQLRTEPSTLRVCDSVDTTWQGNLYEQFGLALTGEKRSANDEEARPQLQIFNPEGLFNPLIRQRLLDRATIIRRKVLLKHIELDLPIYEQRMWYVSRVADATAGQSVTLELRSMIEGPNARVPARQYIPPEFPMVRLR